MAANANLYFASPAVSTDIHPKGESGQMPHWIGIKDSFSFSCKNAETLSHQTSGAGAGMAEFAEFKFKKYSDSASPDLYAALIRGGTFINVQLLCYRQDGTPITGTALADRWYMKWTFNELVVKNIKYSGSENAPEEEIECRFASLKFEYRKSVGGMLIAAGEDTWNAVENSPTPALT